MDDPATAKKPFEGNVQAGYNAQSGNSQSSTLLANTNMTGSIPTRHIACGGSQQHHLLQRALVRKVRAGGRTRYNLTDRNYLFGGPAG